MKFLNQPDYNAEQHEDDVGHEGVNCPCMNTVEDVQKLVDHKLIENQQWLLSINNFGFHCTGLYRKFTIAPKRTVVYHTSTLLPTTIWSSDGVAYKLKFKFKCVNSMPNCIVVITALFYNYSLTIDRIERVVTFMTDAYIKI